MLSVAFGAFLPGTRWRAGCETSIPVAANRCYSAVAPQETSSSRTYMYTHIRAHKGDSSITQRWQAQVGTIAGKRYNCLYNERGRTQNRGMALEIQVNFNILLVYFFAVTAASRRLSVVTWLYIKPPDLLTTNSWRNMVHTTLLATAAACVFRVYVSGMDSMEDDTLTL